MVKPLRYSITVLLMGAIMLVPLHAGMANMTAKSIGTASLTAHHVVLPDIVVAALERCDQRAGLYGVHYSCSSVHDTCTSCAHCCVFLPVPLVVLAGGSEVYLSPILLKSATLVVAPHFRPPQTLTA